jgi:hypothetical protein
MLGGGNERFRDNELKKLKTRAFALRKVPVPSAQMLILFLFCDVVCSGFITCNHNAAMKFQLKLFL